MAGYYFNEQLMLRDEIDGVYAEVMEDYLEELSQSEEPKFSIVKDKTQKDIDEKIVQEAKTRVELQDIDGAISRLSQIEKDSPCYGEAMLDKAFIYLNVSDAENAYSCVKGCIESGYKSLVALTLAIDLSSALGLKESFFYRQMLIDWSPIDDYEKYKLLTVLCDYNMFDKALSVANELLSVNPNDANTSYVKGFLLYNNGDFKGAELYFKRAYLLSYSYPSLFYLKVAQRAVDGKACYDKLKIAFDVPEDVAKENSQIIKDFVSGEKNLYDYTEKCLLELADWCFSSGDDSLAFSLSWIFLLSGEKSLLRKVKDQLVSPAVSDSVKQSIVSIMCDCTDEAKVKVVYENFFMTLTFNRPDFKEENRELFKKAYAKAFGRLSILNIEKLYRLSIGAMELQNELIASGKINEIKGISTLACAMYFYSGLNVFVNSDAVYDVFSAKKEDVVKIIKMTEIKDEN